MIVSPWWSIGGRGVLELCWRLMLINDESGCIAKFVESVHSGVDWCLFSTDGERGIICILSNSMLFGNPTKINTTNAPTMNFSFDGVVEDLSYNQEDVWCQRVPLADTLLNQEGLGSGLINNYMGNCVLKQ